MSNNTNKYTFIVLTIILWTMPIKGKAQIMDYIEEKITDYVKEKAEDYIDEQTGGIYSKAKNFLTNPIGTLWGAYVEKSARSSVAEKASGLANFNVSEGQLNILRRQYGIAPLMSTDQKTLILPIQYGISESIDLVTLPDGNRKIGSLGDGNILHCTKIYLDSLNAVSSVRALEDVLVKETLDSLKEISNEIVNSQLLEDINVVPQLITTLNRHPEAVRVYANSMSTSLRYQPFHLIYWSSKADSHRNKLPRKTKLPNPRSFLFKQKGDEVTIWYNGLKLGVYSLKLHKIDCLSAELLNYIPMPNCSYAFGSTVFSSDILGRLTYLNTPLNTKGKVIIKTCVKTKDLQKAVGIDGKNTIYSKMLKKLKLQPAIAFLQTPASCLSSEKVKEEQKAFKNIVKQSQNVLANFMFCYENGFVEPQAISISNVEKANSLEIPAKEGDLEEQQKFVQNLKSIKKEHYVMDGNIGGTYPIVMNIVCQGGTITGNYFYSKFGNKKRMVLRGTINNKRYAEVKEYDENGVYQGQFNGKIQHKGIFKGTFIKKNKRMAFSVKSLL